MNEDSTVIYRIDKHDRIIFVNDAWERFAAANDAPNLMPKNVLNTSLWNHITDPSTRYFYQEFVYEARLFKPLVFNFRCDSPARRRVLEMRITYWTKQVQFEVRPVKIEDRAPQKLLDQTVPRSDELIPVCSWCKRINVDGDVWLELEDAVAALDLFADEKPPGLKHGICPECYRTFSPKAGLRSSDKKP